MCVAYSFLFWITIWPLSSSLDLKGEAGAWHLKELQAKKHYNEKKKKKKKSWKDGNLFWKA